MSVRHLNHTRLVNLAAFPIILARHEDGTGRMFLPVEWVGNGGFGEANTTTVFSRVVQTVSLTIGGGHNRNSIRPFVPRSRLIGTVNGVACIFLIAERRRPLLDPLDGNSSTCRTEVLRSGDKFAAVGKS